MCYFSNDVYGFVVGAVSMHLYQKVPFVLACFQASAAPRLENPDSDEKDALFGLDTLCSLLIKCNILIQKCKIFWCRF
jgi:hypothetical protein